MSRSGMEFVLLQPEDYELMPESAEITQSRAGESGGGFSYIDSLEEAF